MSGICFIDTETTSLRHDRRAWEIGIITRDDDGHEREEQWFVDIDDLDLGNADVMSLKIGRFHDRHPHITAVTPPAARVAREKALLLRLEELTRGAHLAGAVVSFDADVLGQRMRANGICPSWHYHLIDVEALAAGYLAGSYHAIREVGKNPDADGPTGKKRSAPSRRGSPTSYHAPSAWTRTTSTGTPHSATPAGPVPSTTPS